MSISGETMIHRQLLKAAISGDARSVKEMASQDQSVLLGRTINGSTCLHIAASHGHEAFCKEVVALDQSLLSITNSYGETPLLVAVTSGHASIASVLLRCCRERGLGEAILKEDDDKCNALHHAIRTRHRDLSLELIEAEPGLSKGVNKYRESPMYIAVMRDLEDVFEILLKIPDSSDSGTFVKNALHAAVRNDNPVAAKKLMETRPWLAKQDDNSGQTTPIAEAIIYDRIEVLRVLLECDPSLGYLVGNTPSGRYPLLVTAAFRGRVGAGQELLKHCPDCPNRDASGWTCLHQAVYEGQLEFVEFILRTPQLRKVINMLDSEGKTALHHAVKKCNPQIVAALLNDKDMDFTIFDKYGGPAGWELSGGAMDTAKTLNWNEVSMLISKADPQYGNSYYTLHKKAKQKVIEASRKDAKSLTQTYTNNTSLVAILIATISFAAAFTLPGGYTTDSGSEGLPIMTRKSAFQAFLIFDTLAMCSSIVVAFICIIARWEDFEFLVYYRSITTKIMWFAYLATTLAFATGLYTVLAPRLPWLAIGICVFSVLLPIITKLIGEWPIFELRFRLSHAFNSDLLDMV